MVRENLIAFFICKKEGGNMRINDFHNILALVKVADARAFLKENLSSSEYLVWKNKKLYFINVS